MTRINSSANIALWFIICRTLDASIDNGSSKNSDEEALYIDSYFSITCCRQGTPVLESSIDKYAKNLVAEKTGVIFADQNSNVTCDRFNGKYSIPIHKEANVYVGGVMCQCNEPDMDRNCRQIKADCKNGGYRSFSINLRCSCPGSYFGELCEKNCLNGLIRKNTEDTATCECFENFYGDECDNVLCHNGGESVGGRSCSCPSFVHGRHCEIPLVSEVDSGSCGGIIQLDVLVRIAAGLSFVAFMLCFIRMAYSMFKQRHLPGRTSVTAAQNFAPLTIMTHHLPTYDEATKQMF